MNDYEEMNGVEYETMYARYTDKRDPVEMLRGFVEGKVVLDLCGGSLLVASRAKELGATHVIGHDASFSMLQTGQALRRADEIYVCDLTDEGELNSMIERFKAKVDIIVCRQAINYWWSRTRVRKIAQMLRDQDARFIFNTFHDPPPEKIQIRHYEHNGVEFVELIERSGEKIHHIQYCNMMAPHFTSFQWIPEKTILADLQNIFFTHTVCSHGNSRLYFAWGYKEKSRE